MDPYIQKALFDMGLAGEPIERLRFIQAHEVEEVLANLKKVAHQKGRQLLKKYHPDRNPADEEAARHFQAVKLVFEKIDTLRVVQPPKMVTHSVTYYPSASTSGSSVTVQTTYYTQTQSATQPYDARRVVDIKPK